MRLEEMNLFFHSAKFYVMKYSNKFSVLDTGCLLGPILSWLERQDELNDEALPNVRGELLSELSLSNECRRLTVVDWRPAGMHSPGEKMFGCHCFYVFK